MDYVYRSRARNRLYPGSESPPAPAPSSVSAPWTWSCVCICSLVSLASIIPISLSLSLSLGCGAHIMVVRDALSLLNLERDTVPALAPSAPSRGGKQEEKDGWVVSNVVRRRVDCLTARSFVRRAGCPEILQSVHMRRGENEPSAALHARTSRLPRFSASSRVFCMRLNTTYTRIRNSM